MVPSGGKTTGTAVVVKALMVAGGLEVSNS